MLAVTSNWALHDGSLAVSRAGRASSWLEAVGRTLVRAGWCRDGLYRPLEDATLIFGGDTFDWLLSEAWAGRDRPWHGGTRGDQARSRVAVAAIQAALPIVRRLARWARTGVSVPAATPQGRPSPWATHRVRMRIVVLAGDRDAWLADVAAAAGRLGIVVGEEWSDGVRHVRHGHDLEPLAHRGGLAPFRGGWQPTLAESLSTDLLVRFAVAARDQADLWPHLRPRLAAVSAARPSQWPRVVAGMAVEAGDRQRLGSLWRRAVAGWHQAALRDLPACDAEFDALAALAAWLDQASSQTAVPEAIRRLDGPVALRTGAKLFIAAPTSADSPSLACNDREGAAWVEPLGEVPVSPSIMAIGVHPAGRGFIDAA